jgi:tetratricopeptide (TPR) repeat protein
MGQRLFFLRIGLAALLMTAFAAAATAQSGRINGVVKDDDGQPVKGATVTAENENIGSSQTASTDDKGRFSIIGLRPGQWVFVAMAPGHSADGGRLGVRAASNLNPPMTFTLKRTSPGIGGALERVSAKDLQSSLAAAETLFEQKKWDEAIAAYRSILVAAPPLSVVHLQIAAAYLGKQDYEHAAAAYNDLLKVQPSNEKAAVGLAAIKSHQGDPRGAEEALMRAAQGPETGREVFYALGEMSGAAGRHDEATEWFRKAHGSDPYWGKPLYRLGLSAMNGGDASAAAAYLEKVIRVDPASPEAALARTALNQLNK